MSKKALSAVSGFLVMVLLVLGDQYVNYLAFTRLRGQAPFVVIPDVFELEYLENTGAAFGLFQNARWVFMIGTVLVIAAVLVVYYLLPMEKKYRPLRVIAVFLCAGAAGNMIDRVFRGYVIDMFSFSLIDFPIFNLADVYVVLSMAAFLYFFLFRYKESDFDFLTKKREKKNGKENS